MPGHKNFYAAILLIKFGCVSQLQHDYIMGNYPVGRDDAAQLSALQILVDIGFVGTPESSTLVFLLIISSLCLYSTPFLCGIYKHRAYPIVFLFPDSNLLRFIFFSDWNSLLERFLPRQIAITRAKREWELDILSRYHSMVK